MIFLFTSFLLADEGIGALPTGQDNITGQGDITEQVATTTGLGNPTAEETSPSGPSSTQNAVAIPSNVYNADKRNISESRYDRLKEIKEKKKQKRAKKKAEKKQKHAKKKAKRQKIRAAKKKHRESHSANVNP